MRIYQLQNGNRVTARSDADIERIYPGQWTFLEELMPAARVLISTEAFFERFTFAERVSIDLALQHDPAATNLAKRDAAKRRIRIADLRSELTINLRKSWVVNFVRELETDGILATGRADAILLPPISSAEAPI